MDTIFKFFLCQGADTFEKAITSHITKPEEFVDCQSQPLIPMDLQLTDEIMPLTPGHFLVGTSLAVDPDASTSKSFGKRLRLINHITNYLWKDWKTEYSRTMY